MQSDVRPRLAFESVYLTDKLAQLFVRDRSAGIQCHHQVDLRALQARQYEIAFSSRRLGEAVIIARNCAHIVGEQGPPWDLGLQQCIDPAREGRAQPAGLARLLCRPGEPLLPLTGQGLAVERAQAPRRAGRVLLRLSASRALAALTAAG